MQEVTLDLSIGESLRIGDMVVTILDIDDRGEVVLEVDSGNEACAETYCAEFDELASLAR
ncbi:preprotein translocase subunit YajC [Calycomorphotria hydatis]|uniref:Carbon storage regulator n=1 Tax=Calycomorphotria hydatis TaxID=2528027 RepID=A0A517TC43_9PLAN|nr:preprotein translocase subunit YajC [Calycomorphotria hydatis]QDT65939.1 hypothetical protein V22_32020 [Calycomorphotria hydatis]